MELENRKKIMHKYNENPSVSFTAIAKAIGTSRTTVSRVIQRFKNSLSIKRAKGDGRKPGPANKTLAENIRRSLKQNPGLPDRDRAKKYGTLRETVRRIRLAAGYKTYRAIKTPNRNNKQNLVALTRSRKLYDNVLTKFDGCLIMDDETYVKVDQKQIPGQKWYVATKRLGVADKYKFVKVDKFGKKMLLWQAVCSCGLKSKAFATSSTLTSDLYIEGMPGKEVTAIHS